MLKEARDPKYLVDAYWIREFGHFPPGCDPDQFTETQREFVVLLSAVTPTAEVLGNILNYQWEKQEVEAHDFVADARKELNADMIRVYAATASMTEAQAREIKAKERAITLKAERMHRLNERYGIARAAEDSGPGTARAQAVEFYKGMSERMAAQQQQLHKNLELLGRPGGAPVPADSVAAPAPTTTAVEGENG